MELFSFDEAYLQRLRQRDFATEQHFVTYFNQLLFIKLRSRLGPSHAVDDIRQETFARVLKALQTEGGIRSAGGLGAFVNSVCNNVLQEFYRSSSRVTQIDDDTPEHADPSVDLDGMLVSKQTRDHVRQILAKLPEKDCQVLKALFIEEQDKDQICQKFGVDRDYLRVLVHRAKQNFRAFYEKSASGSRNAVGI